MCMPHIRRPASLRRDRMQPFFKTRAMTPANRRQIEELYQAARDPAKRAEVLAAADPELRREVESLLAQDSSKTGAVDQAARAGVAGPDSAATVITSGVQIGPYKIEGLLGAADRRSRRTRDRARRRNPAPRYQACQYPGCEEWLRETGRLWPGEA